MFGRVSPSAAPVPRRWRAVNEAGDSLIEVLITVSIVGIGVVAILTTMGSTFRLSAASRTGSHGDQMLVRYAENLLAVAYQPCTSGSTPYVAAATSAIPAGNLPDGIVVGPPGTTSVTPNAFELSISSVAYWNGDLSPATFSTTCPPSDPGSQELTLRVHGGGASFDRTLMIVKRRP